MRNKTIFLWCKKDIAALIGCEVRMLDDLISEETKIAINFIKRASNATRYKVFKLNDVLIVLNDVYPFKTQEERLKMILPSHYK